MNPVLDIADLSVAYLTPRGRMHVLRGVNLDLCRGEVVGLVGESGSGKSTLAYAIMGYLSPNAEVTGGRVLLDGAGDLLSRSASAMNELRGKRLAMVYQDPNTALNPTLRLGEQVAEILVRHKRLSRRDAWREAMGLLERVSLPDPAFMMGKYPHEVSGGEKQRLLIAMAFACQPDCLIFDEPTTALDATTAAGILELLRRLQVETGVSVLYISHDLAVVSQICQRVSVIYAGEIVEEGRVTNLLTAPRHPYSRALLASIPNPYRGGRQRRLAAFGGLPPDWRALPVGCCFQQRCPFVVDACRQGPLPLAGEPEHRTSCSRWTELSAKPLPGQSHGLAASREMGEGLLKVENLTVHYGRYRLVDQLLRRSPERVYAVAGSDFKLRVGETFGLVGESGCGKSTLARALAGLLPFTGRIELGGRRYDAKAALDGAYRRAVQIVFQHPDLSLNPRHTVGEIVSRPLRLYEGLASRKLKGRVGELLEQVRLPADYARRYPHELSGGEKQRVAIARAFGSRPRIVICDEITSGLDVSVQASIVNLLADLQDAHGTAYLFITHDLNLIQHLADRVAIMYLGRMVELRDAEGLYKPPYHLYTEALLSAVPVPETDISVRRVRLQGPLPSPKNPPPGCCFESRCPRRLGERCRDAPPPLRRFEENHWIACHIEADELAHTASVWSQTSRS